MSIFRWKPEEPVEDENRYRGGWRFGERLERDLRNYLLASLLAFVGLLPYILGVGFAVATHSVFPLLVAGILGGMIAAPQLCGLVDTTLRSLRDEIGMWWHTYQKAWKTNFRSALLPGAFFGLLFAVQIFVVSHVGLMDYPLFELVMLAVVFLLLMGIAAYFVPMLVMMELPFEAILKNSLLLFLRNLPKSLTASLILCVFFAAIVLWFPISTVYLALGGLWVPVLLSCRIVYPILDRDFGLTAALEELQKQTENPADIR